MLVSKARILSGEKMDDKPSETAKQRSNMYGLLTLIYRTEVTKTLLQHIREPGFLSVLSDMGAGLENDFLNRSEDELIEDLAVEYAWLFIGPGKHISPHESVHHEREDGDYGKLWGRSTVDVKLFIEKAGLEYKTEYTGLPDHISVEFEFMKELTGREAQAWEEDDKDAVASCRKIQKIFIDEHISQWVPGFCDRAIKAANLDFYRNISRLTKEFVIEEQQILSGTF